MDRLGFEYMAHILMVLYYIIMVYISYRHEIISAGWMTELDDFLHCTFSLSIVNIYLLELKIQQEQSHTHQGLQNN